MKVFLKKLLLFSLPILLLFVILIPIYIYFDPFKVIYSYNDYSFSPVTLNWDFVSTETYINKHTKYNYNSFIFGSSRTMAYLPSSWKKHLNNDDQPFVFASSGESIFGIYTKIKYLDKTNAKIDNALVILCRDASFLREDDNNGHLFIKHPVISNNGRFHFHFTLFKAFLNPHFLYAFFEYKMKNEYKPFMSGYIEKEKISFDTVTNEIHILNIENELNNNPEKYYAERKAIFYKQKGETIDLVNRVKSLNLYRIREIASIFKKHHTKYKVVISPLYEQIKFSSNDRALLNEVFEENLYDFSGSNKFTNSITNYYESSHYRPCIGDSIMNIIYK